MKYEYIDLTVNCTLEELNKMGSEGWRIVEKVNRGSGLVFILERENTKPIRRNKIQLQIPENEYKDIITEWIEYRKSMKKPIKTQKSLDACVRQIKKLSGDNVFLAKEIVNKSIANSYQGLFAINTPNKHSNTKNVNDKWKE